MIIRRERPLQMIICHPRHHSQLCQDPDSISQTFLEQLDLVDLCEFCKDQWVFCYLKELVGSVFFNYLFCQFHCFVCFDRIKLYHHQVERFLFCFSRFSLTIFYFSDSVLCRKKALLPASALKTATLFDLMLNHGLQNYWKIWAGSNLWWQKPKGRCSWYPWQTNNNQIWQ